MSARIYYMLDVEDGHRPSTMSLGPKSAATLAPHLEGRGVDVHHRGPVRRDSARRPAPSRGFHLNVVPASTPYGEARQAVTDPSLVTPLEREGAQR